MTDKQARLEAALRMCEAEFLTLVPRLPNPYRRNAEACIKAARKALADEPEAPAPAPPDEPFALHVAPRYTCGSPALVSRRTGEGVAKDEREAYDAHLTGLYGAAGVEKAKRLGLSRIVWERSERRGTYHFRDEITGETWEERAPR